MASASAADLVGAACAPITLGSQLGGSTGRVECFRIPIRRFVDKHIANATGSDQRFQKSIELSTIWLRAVRSSALARAVDLVQRHL
jgi:hypothetical protein